MARTVSAMLPLGTTAPDFRLPDPALRITALRDLPTAPALLVAFLCNHCPYVKHIRPVFARRAAEWQARGVQVVAIASNDAVAYPEDGPAAMAAEITAAGYTFPYLFDADQAVAKAYHAACTPDFFLFDAPRKLAYRGRFCASRPKQESAVPVTGDDLAAAVDAVLAGRPAPAEQRPSLGCNIKWKPGNEPAYAAGLLVT